LLAAGADLSAERLLAAYRRGIFPWYSPGDPILWWSPDPRMVLHPAEVKVSRSLAKVLRNRPYTVRCDTAFAEVIDACAAPREDQAGTWITPEVRAGYLELHRLGYAHAFETWIDGELAGGLYGVAVGRMFFGESMFSRRADASKIALVHAARWLGAAGFGLIDCQMHTEHLESMGARAISRSRFLRNLAELVDAPSVPGPWHLVATTLDVRDGASPV
jgi:leucyl/phenylalanyl-tRNA--protein transferase